MASLDSLPADERAVLQMVLQRGRSYDEIAEMLAIDRAAVRQRALQALDGLGPHTRVPPERRALITDYLLGQLPSRLGEDTRKRLAESPSERAWARVIASELSPLAASPLPEIPVESGPPGKPAPAAPEPAPALGAGRTPRGDGERPRSSRRGGAILLGLLALAVIVAVVVVLVTSGGSGHKTTSASASTTSSTTSTGSTSSPQIIGQINLNSPSSGSKAAGLAELFKRGATVGILIAAQNVIPNTKHDAYAVWLFNSRSDSHLLGFVNPGVGSNGRLSTAGALPANAGHFKQLLVTRESARNPKQPGTIVLEGALTGLS
jgi:Sigma-70, region 4